MPATIRNGLRRVEDDRRLRTRLQAYGVVALSVMLLPARALAQGGNLQPVQSTLQQLIQVLTGPIATSLAILAVIALGMLAWVGRLTWYLAGSIIFGIVLVFGSTQIVQFFQSAVGR